MLKASYQQLVNVFTFYAAMGSGDAFSMQFNAYSELMDDARIPEPGSKTCGSPDLSTLFIAANVEENPKSEENKVNYDRALMRFEFLEVIIRVAIAKYLKSKVVERLWEAVELLLTENIPLADPIALTDPNHFRKRCLYTEDVDLLLTANRQWLKRLFDSFNEKKVASSKLTGRITLSAWLEMMHKLDMFNEVRGQDSVCAESSAWRPNMLW